MMTTIIVPHAEDHETNACPHCGISLCGHYPAPWEEGDAEVCQESWMATGDEHVLNCDGLVDPAIGRERDRMRRFAVGETEQAEANDPSNRWPYVR